VVIRFSQYFNLGKIQSELDFVDIPLDKDIKLYLDPYALSVVKEPWYQESHSIIVDFFQELINSIRKKDKNRAVYLLSHLHENNETRLGLSLDRPGGRGVDEVQATQLYERFEKSKAVVTGKIHDIGDCELLIPGVGNDKISDITTNIIKSKLIQYTQEQCESHNIPMQDVAVQSIWDPQDKEWISMYAKLPQYLGGYLLLIPKRAVRRQLTFNHGAYENFALHYLRGEHLSANSSLVKVLKRKTGEIRIVLIKDIKADVKQKFSSTKDFLFDFSEKHPASFHEYKIKAAVKSQELTDYEIEYVHPQPIEDKSQLFIEQLKLIQPGRPEAGKYHKLVKSSLEFIFTPVLQNFVIEQELDRGIKRVDIVANNRDSMGFFHNLTTRHQVKAPYIFIECKNYQDDPVNPEFDQLAGRLDNIRGQFGVLFTRKIEKKEATIARLRTYCHREGKYIITIDDNELTQILQHRGKQETEKIDELLESKVKNLVL
jgi:hypothetical protein